MDTGELLLAAIRSHPVEDTPRLEYADWLDERGRGNDHARAEFIRVQVEIATHPEWGCRSCCRTGRAGTFDVYEGVSSEPCECLWGRQSKLWPLQRVNVLRLGRGLGEVQYTVGLPGDDRPCKFRRGFLSSVRLPLTHFYEHAATVFRESPVDRVEVNDKEAVTSGGRWAMWCRDEEGDVDPETRRADDWGLPAELFDRLPDGDLVEATPRRGSCRAARMYTTVHAASAALSFACVTLGRELAGLPRLPAVYDSGERTLTTHG